MYERGIKTPILFCLVLIFAAGNLEVGARANSGTSHKIFTAPDPTMLALLSLGHKRLAADLAWLDAVRYFGGTSLQDFDSTVLDAMIRATITLAPDFKYPYLFGGLALTSSRAGIDAADALLTKGMQRFPEDWLFPFYIGVNAMIFRDDLRRAAEHFGRASHRAGAPPYLAPLAARLYSSAGDCKQALEFLATIQNNAKDELLRKRIAERQRHVVWDCNLQIVEVAVESFRQHTGRAPASIKELTRAGYLPQGPPIDPYGGEYYIDAEGKAASTSPHERLGFKIPAQFKEQLTR